MIYIDDEDPERPLEPSFPPRNVIIKRGVKAEELYDLITEVGRGKFGTVYKCREKATGLKLAAKFVPIPKREDRRNVEREVEIMNSLQHHLIIQLYAAYEYQKMMCVVLELIEGGELFDRVIDDDFVLTERVCTVFMRQVCEAMQFIHRNNILHLDLKPENILCLTKEGNRIKIIDFGLARKYDPDKKLQVLFGTPEFVAPEVVNFDCISYGTDMWSVGVICYVLLSGLSPFMGETDLETMANVTIAKYDFDDEAFNNVSPEALDFITKLLDKDRSSRMTATECLEHEWLQRRPRPPPPAPPKPAAVPMTIYTTVTPPSPTHDDDAEAKELETTKDNLRTFIERWEEHPNSPYVFDTGANLIAPLRDTRKDSVVSSRACSPSPCESISSISEDNANSETASQIKEKEQNEEAEDTLPDILVNRGFRDYLQSFDRRNSDTSYILGRQPQHSGERVNLADEIRKLSDHLLMLAEINTKLGQENDEDNKQTQQESTESQATASTRKTTTQKSSSERSIISQSNSTSVITDSIQEMDEETTTTESTTKVSKLTVRLQSVKETSKIESNGRSDDKISEKTKRMINGFKQFSAIQEDEMNYEAGLGVPWPITNKRIKFKINQMSRDVPIGSPDTHQAFNLEETANTTKDCLLHLLEKYNEQRFRNRGRGRLQSISVDWNSSDNLECRSMSSINAFFQRHTTHGEKINQLRAQLEAKSKF